MSKNHAQAGDYAGAMEARGVPKVCGYRHRIADWGPCHGSLQRDHVDELRYAPWQNPKTARLVYACEHHHNCKTTETGRATKQQGGQMTDTAPRLPKVKGATSAGGRPGGGKGKRTGGGWRRTALTVGGLAIVILTALSAWFNITDPIVGALRTWGPLALACALAVGGARYGPRAYRRVMRARNQERADWLIAQAAGIARKMQCAPDAVRIEPRGRKAWTREGLCMRGRVNYPAHVLDDDPKLRKAVEDHWRHKLGDRALVIEWNVGLNWLDYRLPASQAPAPTEAPAAVEAPSVDPAAEHAETIDNLSKSLGQQFKDPEITVEVVARAADHSPTALRVFYGTKFPDARDTARAAFLDAIQAKTEARWRPDWQKPRNRLMLARRPEMPAFAPNPIADMLMRGEGVPYRFPLGVNEHGEIVYWDIYDAPHALIAGGTGGGKTVTLHDLIWWASAQGWDIVLIDPKGVGLGGLRDLPGVIRHALADPEEINRTLVWAEAMMRQRYWRVLNEGASYTDFRRCLIVVDEFADLVTILRQWWKGLGEKGDPAGLSAVTAIPRLGRECNVLEVVGIQQAAAGFFDGTEARDNYGLRLGLGPQTQQSADMLFGRADAGRDVPQEAKGRATIALKQGEPQEMQTFWTPTLMPNGKVKPRRQEDAEPHPDDVAAIARLREAVAALPRQPPAVEVPPDPVPEPAPEPARPTRRRTTTRTRQSQQRAEDDPEAVTAPVPPPNATRRTPAPSRPQQAAPVHLRALRLAVTCGTPLWVIDEGEAVQVVGVGDEDDEGLRLVTFRDARGAEREADVPADTLFEEAPRGDETSG